MAIPFEHVGTLPDTVKAGDVLSVEEQDYLDYVLDKI